MYNLATLQPVSLGSTALTSRGHAPWPLLRTAYAVKLWISEDDVAALDVKSEAIDLVSS